MIELYLSSLKGRTEKTIKSKRNRLKHLEGFFEEYGETYIFDEATIGKFYDYLETKSLAPSTIRFIFQEVKSYLLWLRKRGYYAEFDEDAYRNLWKGRRVQTKLKQDTGYFTEEEAERVLDAIMGRVEGINAKHPIWYVFTLVLLYSGLRLSEALSLTPDDLKVKRVLDEEGNEREILYLHVREGKFGKEREAPLILIPRKRAEILKRFFGEKKQKGEPLWKYEIRYPKKDGTYRVKEFVLNTDSVEKFYRRLSKELGIKVRPHKFRSTYATWLSAKGYPLEYVQMWLGHESPVMTLKAYARARKEKETEVILTRL